MKIKLIIVSLLTVAGLQGMEPQVTNPQNVDSTKIIQALACNAIAGRGALIVGAAQKVVIPNFLPVPQNQQTFIKSFLSIFKNNHTRLNPSIFLVTPNNDNFDAIKCTLDGLILKNEPVAQNSSFTDLNFNNVDNKQDICMVNSGLTKERIDKLLSIFDMIIFNQPENTPYTDAILTINDPGVTVLPILDKDQLTAALTAEKKTENSLNSFQELSKKLKENEPEGDPAEIAKKLIQGQKLFNIATNPAVTTPTPPTKPSFLWNHKGKLFGLVAFIAAAGLVWARYIR